MTAGGPEVDYADMAAAAAGFSAVAGDLEAGQLAPDQASMAVYGEAALVVAVTRVTEALRACQQALADTSRLIATTLEDTLVAYRAADARQEEAYRRIFGQLVGPGGGAAPRRPGSTSAQVR